MSDPVVLNPGLYTMLKKVAREVKISNHGEPLRARIRKDILGRRRVEIISPGEYYRICCPMCRESRHRLYINHRWNTTYEGESLFFMVRCHNENCEQEPGFYNRLREYIGRGKPLATAAYTQQEAPIAKNKNGDIKMDGKFTRVSKLPDDHAAVRYLREVRKLDVQEAGEVWDIRWCEYSTVLPPNNRLFFPVIDLNDNGERYLHSAQAHWLDLRTLSGTPEKGTREVKWFTAPGSKVHQTLYNGWRARNQKDIVVVCEGAFDVMTVGKDHGVALFGHSASMIQRNLLWDHWGSKGAAAVLALDPDAMNEKSVKDLIRWFEERDWFKFIILEMPGPNTDIGDLSRDESWDMIDKELCK